MSVRPQSLFRLKSDSILAYFWHKRCKKQNDFQRPQDFFHTHKTTFLINQDISSSLAFRAGLIFSRDLMPKSTQRMNVVAVVLGG